MAHAGVLSCLVPSAASLLLAGGCGAIGSSVEEATAPQRTMVVVEERPIIEQGTLPPIVPGADRQEHGLLIGLPGGTTFEYRADDVRLLGVRQGEFLSRNSIEGGGGFELEPLGAVSFAFFGGRPGPTYGVVDERGRHGVTARLTKTWVRDVLHDFMVRRASFLDEQQRFD